MEDKKEQGCGAAWCIIRLGSIPHQHTNGPCQCLRDIPLPLRMQVQRKLLALMSENESVLKENTRLRIKCGVEEMNEGDFATYCYADSQTMRALQLAEEELRFDRKHCVVKETGEPRLVSHALNAVETAIAINGGEPISRKITKRGAKRV